MEKEQRTHTIFWRKKVLFDLPCGRYEIVEYRMFKATNKNTMRRLKGEGWFFEFDAVPDGQLRTRTECKREIKRMNDRTHVEIEDIISILKKECVALVGEAVPAPSTSLLLKPMGGGQ